MTTKDVAVQLDAISKAPPDTAVRACRRAVAGETVIHQGDVYLHRVADGHPRGKALGTRQVAVGTTVGSRHIVDGPVSVYEGKALPPGFKVPDWTTAQEMLGPLVVADEPFTLTHPEHSHHELPSGCWQVTYQADYSTRQRVQD